MIFNATRQRFGCGVFSSFLFFIGLFIELGVASLMAEEVTSVHSSLSEPYFARQQRLSQKDVSEKEEGQYFLGIPLANYDPDTGYGIGFRLFSYYNGERSDPMFYYTPYLQKLYFQYFTTTNGAFYHIIHWDAPYIADTPYRLRVEYVTAENPSTNYFPVGNQSLKPLVLPQNLQDKEGRRSSKTFAAHDRSISQQLPDGTTYSRYNDYLLRFNRLNLYVDRDLAGKTWRVSGGVRFNEVQIEDYSGKRVATSGNDSGIMGKTKLLEDIEAHKVVGAHGGADRLARIAFLYDTRDFEPNPNRGVFSELVAETSTSWLGSEFDYWRYTASSRFFYTPFPKKVDLVLAMRALYYVQVGPVPFFAKMDIVSSEKISRGIGGLDTLRGYKYDRFVGNVGAVTNFEVRWTIKHTELFSQHVEFLLVPFLDFGRVFDDVKQTSFKDWKVGEGLGFRAAINQATVIVFDYGFSSEDQGLYVNFNHSF